MKLRQLVDKALRSKSFWDQLKKDPVAALQSVGAKPTPQQLKALKEIDYKSLEVLARAFSNRMT